MNGSPNKPAPTVLYISNLHESTGFHDLTREFSRFGAVRSSMITQTLTKAGTKKLENGTVVFFDPAAAASAQAAMNGFVFRGKPMIVSFEEPPRREY